MATRRGFLKSGSIVLGALTAGTLTPINATTTVTESKIAGFGWEIGNLDNNGANVSFVVRQGMILQWVDIDVAFMITSPPTVPGFAQVVMQGGSFSRRTTELLRAAGGFYSVSHQPGFRCCSRP